MILTSNFTVKIKDGPLAGNQYYGNLSFDNSSLTDVGYEALTPANSLLVNFTYVDSNSLVKTYTQNDANQYPAYPHVEFQDGKFLGLHYTFNNLVIVDNPSPRSYYVNGKYFEYNLDADPGSFYIDGKSFDYSLDGYHSFIGKVTYSTLTPYE